MSKAVLKTICIASAILFVIFAILSIVAVHKAMDATENVSIIGGADMPTFEFFLQENGGYFLFYAAIATFLLLIASGLALIFRKKQAQQL